LYIPCVYCVKLQRLAFVRQADQSVGQEVFGDLFSIVGTNIAEHGFYR